MIANFVIRTSLLSTLSIFVRSLEFKKKSNFLITIFICFFLTILNRKLLLLFDKFYCIFQICKVHFDKFSKIDSLNYDITT